MVVPVLSNLFIRSSPWQAAGVYKPPGTFILSSSNASTSPDSTNILHDEYDDMGIGMMQLIMVVMIKMIMKKMMMIMKMMIVMMVKNDDEVMMKTTIQ